MSLFGRPAEAKPSLFAPANSTSPFTQSQPAAQGPPPALNLFKSSTQDNQAQQGGFLGATTAVQPGGNPFSNLPGVSLWVQAQPYARPKTVPEQISTIMEKWDTGKPTCAFQYYFYNKVDEASAPYYRPGQDEDPKAWEEALANKPGPGYVPVRCVGFEQMGERIKLQERILIENNIRLHQIKGSLEAMLLKHDTDTTVRLLDAKRKHTVIKQRCLALATKVQVLKNRGYAMDGDEEDLKAKLQELEKSAFDPALNARADEIWARMMAIRERAKLLKDELARRGAVDGGEMDEAIIMRAQKILEDYSIQLGHLRKEVEGITEDMKEWEEKEAPKKKAAAKTAVR